LRVVEPMDNLIAIGLAFAFGGILKGATGIAAPISITGFFLAVAIIQLVVLTGLGVMTL